MRAESIVGKALRLRPDGLGATRGLVVPGRALRAFLPVLTWGLAVATLSGCAKVPLVGGSAKAKIELIAAAGINSCGKDQGYPLTFRVLQLTDASPLAGATLVQLWDHEDKLLGSVFVSKSTNDVIDPGSRKELSVEIDDKTRAVVVVGNFCKTSGSCWYHVAPRKAGKGVSMKLVADASCLKPTR